MTSDHSAKPAAKPKTPKAKSKGVDWSKVSGTIQPSELCLFPNDCFE